MATQSKFDWRNGVLVLVSILFTVGFIELILRMVLSTSQSLLVTQQQDRRFIERNAYWGPWHYPNNRVRHIKTCFDAVYETNSLGLKSEELDPERTNIILLGDSYLEGYGTSNDESIAYFMDSLSGAKYNFMPFGSSGGFGTVNQYALYENFARYYETDLVILFWLNYNDPWDNLNAIHRGLIDEDGQFLFKRTSSLEEVAHLLTEMGEAETTDKQTLYALGLAKIGFKTLQNASQYWTNIKGNFKDAIGYIYASHEPEQLTQAYVLSEQVLQALNQAVKRDSANLLLVNLFDPYQVDEGWLQVMSEKLDTPTDPLAPNQRIEEICKQQGIAYLSLYEPTMQEIRSKDMNFPYFNFSCDNHLTKKGNLWVAKLVSEHLKSQQLLD